MRWIRHLAVAGGLLALLAPASAQLHTQSSMVSDTEMMMLPDYCQARLTKGSPSREAWAQRLGKEGFNHLHHYCFGLAYLNRANGEANAKKRHFLAQRAAANFDYVLARWKPSFALYSQAKSGRMRAEMLLH